MFKPILQMMLDPVKPFYNGWEFTKYLIDKNRELETRNNYVFVFSDNSNNEWSLVTDEWSLVTLSELFDKINDQRKKKIRRTFY